MSWILHASSLATPFHQWKSHFKDDGLAMDDYEARAAVAAVYKDGGRLLLSHEIPKTLNFETAKPALRPINQVQDGALVVDEKFKSVLQEFDPDSHQFCPLLVEFKDKPVDIKRYLFNPHRIEDVLDWEQTTTREVKGFDGKIRVKVELNKKHVVLKQAPGEGRPHLFRLEGARAAIAFSDRLHDVLRSHKLLKSAQVFATIS